MELQSYSARETLRDGGTAEIRALRTADTEGLLAALDRMSDESIYRRFFGPRRELTEEEVAYYTKVDFKNHVALVAVLEEDGGELIVGGARCIVTSPGTAEVAFAVDDPHQGRGIGAMLLRHLAVTARRIGVTQLYAEVLPSNTAMLKVFERSGLRASSEREPGVVHVTLRVV
jgi:RimJ/RimL family protein N-acetyltransferase